jgi:hypothetical protein
MLYRSHHITSDASVTLDVAVDISETATFRSHRDIASPRWGIAGQQGLTEGIWLSDPM